MIEKNEESFLENFFLLPTIKMNYLINISKKFKLVYFETPKVACSTIKETLQLNEVDNVDQLPSNIHNKKESPLCSPLDFKSQVGEVFFSNNYFRFSFVRNPFSRVLSCFLDKFKHNEWERSRHLPALGFKATDEITFLDFLKVVKTQKINEMDIHWCPQYNLLGRGKISFDYLGRFETFSYDFENLLHYFHNKHGNLKHKITNVQNHSVGASSKLDEYLTKEAVELIIEIYREDFENFNYGYNPKIR